MYTKPASLKLCIFLLFVVHQGIDSSFGDVERLTEDNFASCISSNPHVLVLFKDLEVCADCEAALDKVEKVAQPEMLRGVMLKRYVADDKIAKKYGASEYPAILFFRHGIPAIYDGNIITESDVLEEWLALALNEGTKTLTDDTFEHLTQAATGATTGDWFVVFYTPSCDTCSRHYPVIETVALRKRQTMNFAMVDIEANPKLVERFKITSHLKGVLFRKGKMYEYDPAKFDSASLIAFVEYWYNNVQARPVPIEKGSFDRLTDSIALNLKESLNDPGKKWIVLLGVVVIAIIVVAITVQVFRKRSGGSQFKYD